MSALAIHCKDLRKTYSGGVEAVRGLDLEVREGECFGLLGPNGAGKTTTIEILEGLLAPSGGEVEIFGRSWGTGDREIREQVGVSLQETRLSEKLTVHETLKLFRSFYSKGLVPDDCVRLVGLDEKAGARVGKLSGGQKQRLALACSLIGDPKLLFLDEPTTGLDPQSRRQIWEILKRFKAEGRTILITTHYMDEAERLCDRVAIVDHGRVIASGSPRELIASLGGEHMIELAVAETSNGGAKTVSEDDLKSISGVSAVRIDGLELALTVTEPHVALPLLLERLEGNGGLTRLSIRHASLEDVFVQLTGRHLRDEEAAG